MWKNWKNIKLYYYEQFSTGRGYYCDIIRIYNNKFANNFNILRGTTWSSQCTIKLQHIIYVYFYVLILI